MATLSMSVTIGNEVITVYSQNLQDLLDAATALREFENDVRIIKASGAKQVSWQHRKVEKQNKKFDYYDLVGNNGVRISCGAYMEKDQVISLFPGGWSRLYNPSVDSREPREYTREEEDKVLTFIANTANTIENAEYTVAKKTEYEAYGRAVKLSSQWREQLGEAIKTAWRNRNAR